MKNNYYYLWAVLLFAQIFLVAIQSNAQRATGLIIPEETELQNQIDRFESFYGGGYEVLQSSNNSRVDASSIRKYDLREKGYIGPVRNQGDCGSCWAFSAAAAYESNYAMRNKKLPNLSKQHMINCIDDGCRGGWHFSVFEEMVYGGKKILGESKMPYNAFDGSCTGENGTFAAVNYGIIDIHNLINFNLMNPTPPDILDIKEAILTHGAVACAVTTTFSWLFYEGGVYEGDPNPGSIDHAVNIIGWDDDKGAWLVRNSWGPYWGEEGHMWLKYGANRIGTFAAWVNAKIEQNTTIDDHDATGEEIAKLGIYSELQAEQEYQEIYFTHGDRTVKWSLNEPGQKVLRRIKLEKGTKPYRILVKTVVDTPAGKQLIIGTSSGNFTIETDRDLKLRWIEQIQGNVYKVSLQ